MGAAAIEKERASVAIAAAEVVISTVNAVSEALEDISGLIGALTAGRLKRQAPSTAHNFAKPQSCLELAAAVTRVRNLLAPDPPQALALVNVLKSIKSSDFTCSPAEASAVNDEVAGAKEQAAKVVKEKTDEIAEETEKYNSAVDTIKETNSALASLGKPTISPGSPLPRPSGSPLTSPPGGSPATPGKSSSSGSRSSAPGLTTTSPQGQRARGIFSFYF